MKIIESPLSIASLYDAFILDLWGVIHDGQKLYPGVRDTLVELREQGKQIIFLSNAPRRANKAEQVLASLGVTHDMYDHVITSGEAVYRHLSEHVEWGRHYFYIGPDKDLDILDGLNFSRSGLAQSNFILNVGYLYDGQPLEELDKTLRSAHALGLPMVCVNPDRVVVRQNGERLGCAGEIADEYTRIGGHVVWFGKPYRDVYHLCLRRFVDAQPSRILAVGDSLETDILGANHAGVDSVLITGGILKQQVQPAGELNEVALQDLIVESGAHPTYVSSSFS